MQKPIIILHLQDANTLHNENDIELCSRNYTFAYPTYVYYFLLLVSMIMTETRINKWGSKLLNVSSFDTTKWKEEKQTIIV